jgi:hypothetical protein
MSALDFLFTLDVASPLLPGTGALWWARRLSWGLVMGAMIITAWNRWGHRGARHAAQVRPPRTLTQLLVLVLVCAVCLLPGVWSPAYWLGLAFQMPSLMMLALALHALNLAFDAPARNAWAYAFRQQSPGGWLNSLSGVALVFSVLGWVLLFDVLAWWPVALYPLGFHGLTAWVIAALALLPWVLWGRQTHLAWLWVMAVVLVFELTRWPTGNVWSALLDPLLWVWCQLWLLRRWFKSLRI